MDADIRLDTLPTDRRIIRPQPLQQQYKGSFENLMC